MAPTNFAYSDVAWKFNPPGALRHGSSLKRLVRRVKRVLYDILGSRRVTEEVLGTTLCLVEQFLIRDQSLPLVQFHVSTELEALSPN